MEPLAKRPRLGPSPQERPDSDDEDELSFLPDEVIKKRDPGERLQESRANAANRLKSTFEHIFQKYEKDFSDVGDEIDLRTGQVVLDNGHLRDMRHEKDIGREDEEEGEGMLSSEMIDDDESEEEGEDEDPNVEAVESCETQGLGLPVEGLEAEVEAEGVKVRRTLRGQSKRAQASDVKVLQPLESSTARRAPVRTQELPTPARLAAEHRLSSLALVRKSPLSQPPMSVGVWGSDNDSLDPAWRTPILPETSSPGTPSSRRQHAMYQMPAVDGSNSLWASTSDAGIQQWPSRPPRPVSGSSPSIRRRIDFSTIARSKSRELLPLLHSPKDYDEDEILVGSPEVASQPKLTRPNVSSPLRQEEVQQDGGDANVESGPSVDEVPAVNKRQRKPGKSGQLNGADGHQTAQSPVEKPKAAARVKKPSDRHSATSNHNESAETTSTQRQRSAQIRGSRPANAEAAKSTGAKRAQRHPIAPSRPPSVHAADESRQLKEATETPTATLARPRGTFQDFVVELRQRRTTPGPLTTVEESPPQLSRLASDAQSLPTPPLDQGNFDHAAAGGGQQEGQSTMESEATWPQHPDEQIELAESARSEATATMTESAPSLGERFTRHELPPELHFSDEDEGFLKPAAVETLSRVEKEGVRIPSRGDPIHPTAVATPAKKQPQPLEKMDSEAEIEAGLVWPSSRDSVAERERGRAAEGAPGKEDDTLVEPLIHEQEEAERPSMAGKPRRRKTLQLHWEAETDHQPRPWLAGPPKRRRASQPAPEAPLQAEPDHDRDMPVANGGDEVEQMALDPRSPDQSAKVGSDAARTRVVVTRGSDEAVSSSRPSRWRESSSPPGRWPTFSSRMATIESLDDSLEAELDDIMAEQELFEEQQRAAAVSESRAEERTEGPGANSNTSQRETTTKNHNFEGPAAAAGTTTPPGPSPPAVVRGRKRDERSSSRAKLARTVQFKHVTTDSDKSPKPTAQEEGFGQAETRPRSSPRRASRNKEKQQVVAPSRAEATAGASPDNPEPRKRGRPPRAIKHEDKGSPVPAKLASTRRPATRPTARRSLPSVLLAAQDDSDDDDPLNAMSLLTSWTKPNVAAAEISLPRSPHNPAVATPKSSHKHRRSSSGLRSLAPPHPPSSSAGPGSLRKRLARDGFGGMRTPTKRRRTAGLEEKGGNEETVDGEGASRGDREWERERAMWSPAGSVIMTPQGHARRCGVDGFTCNRDFCFTCLAG